MVRPNVVCTGNQHASRMHVSIWSKTPGNNQDIHCAAALRLSIGWRCTEEEDKDGRDPNICSLQSSQSGLCYQHVCGNNNKHCDAPSIGTTRGSIVTSKDRPEYFSHVRNSGRQAWVSEILNRVK